MPNILNSLSARNKIFLLAVIILVAIAIPLTIIQVQKQQEIRQRASGENMLLYFTNNESCTSPLTTLPLASVNLPLYLCIAAGTNKEGISGFNITLSAASLTFTSVEATSQNQAGFDTQIANATNTLNIRGFIKNIDNNVPVTTSLPLLKFNVATSQNSGNITMTTTEITSLKQDAYFTVAISPFSFGTGATAAPTQPAVIRYNQQCITDLINSNCGEQPTSDCIQQYSNAPNCIVRTPTPIPGAASGSNSCTANGNWCNGVTPVGKGNCTPAPGFSCNTSFDSCYHCDVLAPTPGQTSTSFSPGRGYNNTSTGNSQSTGVAPTYSPGPTSIPAGYITLYFNVVLPGMSPTMTTAPITATLYQGSSPIGPFNNISLTRQTNSDIFTGDSGTKIRISDIAVGQDYYVEVKAQSYEKQIITGGEQKNPQGLRTVFNNSTLPSVKLRPGDIDGNGTIDGADYGILVACFGNKNIFTGATGRTDCGNKTNNGQFNPDINKDGKVVGDDINLLWRAVNGTL